MTATSMQGDRRPPDRVKHSWRCTRRAPVVETVVADSTGRKRVVSQCTECGGTDLEHRLRDERHAGLVPPEGAVDGKGRPITRRGPT